MEAGEMAKVTITKTVPQRRLRDEYALALAKREALRGGVRGKGRGYSKRDRRAAAEACR
jgi:hypothetical protein